MIVLQGAIYHFRRRVPDRLRPILGKTEIWKSLQTNCLRTAKVRAAAQYVASECLFAEAAMFDAPAEIGENLLYLAHSLRNTGRRMAEATPGAALLLDDIEEGLVEIEAHLTAEKDRLARSRHRLDEAQAVADCLLPEDGDRIRALARRLDALLAAAVNPGVDTEMAPAPTPPPTDPPPAAVSLPAAPTALDPSWLATILREAVSGAVQGMAAALPVLHTPTAPSAVMPAPEPPPAPRPETAVVPPKPRFSELQEAFLTHMVTPPDKDTRARWTPQTRDDGAKMFAIFVELMDDQPVDQYSRADAGEFYDLMRRLPFSHGKNRTGDSAREAIARADLAEAEGKPVRRLKLRTVQRYFNTLSPYWTWLRTRGHVSDNIFSGFEFRGTKANRKKAHTLWTADELERLFRHWWFTSPALRDSARFWLPLIALHSGMRMEEIGHLRPCDVGQEDGIWYFNLCFHADDGWSPKTEAGERKVPVHSMLIRLGLLNLVERRRRSGAPFVFPDLKPNRHGKLTKGFSRLFSKLKVALGVAGDTVFHSFRHQVRTQLGGAPGSVRVIDGLMGHVGEKVVVEPRWVDGVLGLTDEEASEGERTYNKGMALRLAQRLIEAITPPVDLSHLLPVSHNP